MAANQLFIQSIQHAPLVETEDHKQIINPAITLADQFTFELEVNEYGAIHFVGYTPRLKLESLPLGMVFPHFLQEMKPVLDLYADPVVMAKYANGKPRSQGATFGLLQMLTNRW